MFCLFQLLPDDLARYAFSLQVKLQFRLAFPLSMNLQIIRRISGIVHKMIFLQNPIVSCTIESGYPSWKRRRHISPSVRSCTFKDSAPAHVPGGLKDPKALSPFFLPKPRPHRHRIFLIPHYIKKGKVLIRENFALSLIQGFYAFNPHIQPLFIATVHTLPAVTFPVTVHTYVPCNRILLYFSSSVFTPTGGSSVGASLTPPASSCLRKVRI